MTKTTKIIVLCVAALGLLFISTQPNRLPSLVLVTPFLILFLLLFSIIKSSFKKLDLNSHASVGLTALVAAFPVVLLALQSLGQLTMRDAIMLLALFVIAYFYMYRRARTANQ